MIQCKPTFSRRRRLLYGFFKLKIRSAVPEIFFSDSLSSDFQSGFGFWNPVFQVPVQTKCDSKATKINTVAVFYYVIHAKLVSHTIDRLF